jgi:hypothetical protein
MFRKIMKELRPNDPIFLDNTTCVYCGTSFEDGTRTKEHVIGRRFVPKGKLDGQWNLIVWACRLCNGHKADLENDISAITMQPDATGKFSNSDQILVAEAERKGQKAFSHRTGKPVNASRENLTVKIPFAPGIEFTFGLIAEPQADSDRLFELARLHVMAFFYWVTFNPSSKVGGFWQGGFFPVLEVARADWGNHIHRAFMHTVVGWEARVIAVGASGLFKIAIRRHPSAECWSWALEWNQKYRLVGFFGDCAAAEIIVKKLPHLEMTGLGKSLRYHRETPLSEADDKMFLCER